MTAQNHLQAVDIHSHWSTRRGYPLQTETELAQQERTWRSKPEYRSEAEMAEDFRSAGVRVILDFGYTKYLPVDEAREIHDYGFITQEANSDVIIGNWVHFSARTRRSSGRRIPPLPRSRRRVRRARGLRIRRAAGERPGLGALLLSVHRGASAGPHLCRHNWARCRTAGRQRNYP